MAWTKLWREIIQSSMWGENDKVRILWITMLALADAEGFVNAAVPGLARSANISLEDCERALTVLQSPDKYSRCQECEGRRIVTKEGGWEIVSYLYYRNKKGKDPSNHRDYMRKYMRKRRGMEPLPVNLGKPEITENVKMGFVNPEADTDAEAEAEAYKETTTPALPVIKPPTVKEKKQKNKPTGEQISRFSRFWTNYPKHANQPAAMRVFRTINPDNTLVDIMLVAIENQKRTGGTLNPKGGSQYIPNPSSWLSGQRWEDIESAPETIEDDEFKGCATRPITEEEYENALKGIPIKI